MKPIKVTLTFPNTQAMFQAFRDLSEQFSEAKEECESLRDRLYAVNSELGNEKMARRTLEDKLEDMTSARDALMERVNTLKSENQDLTNELARTNQTLFDWQRKETQPNMGKEWY